MKTRDILVTVKKILATLSSKNDKLSISIADIQKAQTFFQKEIPALKKKSVQARQSKVWAAVYPDNIHQQVIDAENDYKRAITTLSNLSEGVQLAKKLIESVKSLNATLSSDSKLTPPDDFNEKLNTIKNYIKAFNQFDLSEIENIKKADTLTAATLEIIVSINEEMASQNIASVSTSSLSINTAPAEIYMEEETLNPSESKSYSPSSTQSSSSNSENTKSMPIDNRTSKEIGNDILAQLKKTQKTLDGYIKKPKAALKKFKIERTPENIKSYKTTFEEDKARYDFLISVMESLSYKDNHLRDEFLIIEALITQFNVSKTAKLSLFDDIKQQLLFASKGAPLDDELLNPHFEPIEGEDLFRRTPTPTTETKDITPTIITHEIVIASTESTITSQSTQATEVNAPVVEAKTTSSEAPTETKVIPTTRLTMLRAELAELNQTSQKATAKHAKRVIQLNVLGRTPEEKASITNYLDYLEQVTNLAEAEQFNADVRKSFKEKAIQESFLFLSRLISALPAHKAKIDKANREIEIEILTNSVQLQLDQAKARTLNNKTKIGELIQINSTLEPSAQAQEEIKAHLDNMNQDFEIMSNACFMLEETSNEISALEQSRLSAEKLRDILSDLEDINDLITEFNNQPPINIKDREAGKASKNRIANFLQIDLEDLQLAVTGKRKTSPPSSPSIPAKPAIAIENPRPSAQIIPLPSFCSTIPLLNDDKNEVATLISSLNNAQDRIQQALDYLNEQPKPEYQSDLEKNLASNELNKIKATNLLHAEIARLIQNLHNLDKSNNEISRLAGLANVDLPDMTSAMTPFLNTMQEWVNTHAKNFVIMPRAYTPHTEPLNNHHVIEIKEPALSSPNIVTAVNPLNAQRPSGANPLPSNTSNSLWQTIKNNKWKIILGTIGILASVALGVFVLPLLPAILTGIFITTSLLLSGGFKDKQYKKNLRSAELAQQPLVEEQKFYDKSGKFIATALYHNLPAPKANEETFNTIDDGARISRKFRANRNEIVNISSAPQALFNQGSPKSDSGDELLLNFDEIEKEINARSAKIEDEVNFKRPTKTK